MAPIIYSSPTAPIEERAFEETSIYSHKHLISTPEHNYIQASPYTDQAHLLDINTLTKPHRLMAQALTIMRPLSGRYATTVYKEAFNWQEVVDRLRKLSETEGPDYVFQKTDFYVIVFRSRVPSNVDMSKLGEMDVEAHREAVESGWLLKYWFGTPDQDGRNLATCVWRHIDDAKLGGGGPGHIKAMQHVCGFYLEWRVERLKLAIEEGAKEWDIVEWTEEVKACPFEHAQKPVMWGWLGTLLRGLGF